MAGHPEVEALQRGDAVVGFGQTLGLDNQVARSVHGSFSVVRPVRVGVSLVELGHPNRSNACCSSGRIYGPVRARSRGRCTPGVRARRVGPKMTTMAVARSTEIATPSQPSAGVPSTMANRSGQVLYAPCSTMIGSK